MDKKFSIIIPCYSTHNYLDVCVNSLLKQTIGFDSLEIIFIDDNSNDNGHTVNKLKEYENKYPDNIVLILNDENMGPGGCRNIALEYASGEYIAYLDSDDWIDDDALENEMEIRADEHSRRKACNEKRPLQRPAFLSAHLPQQCPPADIEVRYQKDYVEALQDYCA